MQVLENSLIIFYCSDTILTFDPDLRNSSALPVHKLPDCTDLLFRIVYATLFGKKGSRYEQKNL